MIITENSYYKTNHFLFQLVFVHSYYYDDSSAVQKLCFIPSKITLLEFLVIIYNYYVIFHKF